MTLNMTAWGEEKRRVVSQAMITISLDMDNVEVLHCGVWTLHTGLFLMNEKLKTALRATQIIV